MSSASVRLFPSYVAALKSYFAVRKKKSGRQSKPAMRLDKPPPGPMTRGAKPSKKKSSSTTRSTG